MKRASVAAVALLLCASCRTPAPPGMSPLPADDPSARRVLDSWNARTATRKALRAIVRLKADRQGEQVRSPKQIVVVERPARLRVEVLGFLNQALAVIVTDGVRYELVRSQDGIRESGVVAPDLLWNEARIALEPEQATAVLLGAAAERDDWTVEAAATDGQGAVRLDLVSADGDARLRASFDRAGRPGEVARLDGAGETIWRVHYRDYEDVAGVPFSHHLELYTRRGETRAEVWLRDVELNPTLAPDIFRLGGDAMTGEEG